MKILQISRQFFPSTGGIENVMYGLGQALLSKGYVNDVLTLRAIKSTGELAAIESDVDGLKVYRIPHVGSHRYPIAPEVLKFIDSYDVLHVHAIDFFVDFLSLTRWFHQKPIIVSTHGGIFHTKWLLPLKKLYFRSFTQLSLSGVNAVVCVSQHDHELFNKIVPDQKLHVISNGVIVEPLLTIQKHIKPGLLLGIGRIVENKRIEKLIQLLPDLAQQFPEVQLVWVGQDPLNRIPYLLEMAREIGVKSRVNFQGQVTDQHLQELLSQAHLFVSAASYEAFGLSTIEAMSSGTVPVVTPVGIHPEVIKAGETGFICSFDNQEAVNCLRQALTLDLSTIYAIGNNARETAKQFSWNNVVDTYIDIYQSISSKTNGSKTLKI
jgi:alpha-1,3-mannosyltransferase